MPRTWDVHVSPPTPRSERNIHMRLTQSGVSHKHWTRNRSRPTFLPFHTNHPKLPCARPPDGPRRPAKLPPAEATAWAGREKGAPRRTGLGTGTGEEVVQCFLFLGWRPHYLGRVVWCLVSLFCVLRIHIGCSLRGKGSEKLMWYHIF